MTDALGRQIDGTLQQLRDAMLSNIGSANQLKQSADGLNAKYQTMIDLLTKLNGNFEKEFKEVSENLKKAVSANVGKEKKNINLALKGSVLRVVDEPLNVMMANLFKCLCAGKIAKNDMFTIKNFRNVMKREVYKNFGVAVAKQTKKVMSKPTSVPAGDTGGGGGGGGGMSGLGLQAEKSWKDWLDELRYKGVSTVEGYVNQVQNTLFGVSEKGNLSQLLIGDLGQKEIELQRLVRQAAYEVQGITGDARGLQQAFADVGLSVAETGVNRTKYFEEYIKSFRAGVKDIKTLRELTKQTLGVEKLLGLEAGQLTEYFRDLNLSGKLNLAQTAAVSRSMVDVARSTGLAGENLKKAVDTSKAFTDNMIKAATFTAASAKNILEIVANAQKLGVGEKTGELLKAATSTNELIKRSSAQVQSFLYNAAGQVGKIQDLQFGIITRSKNGIKELAKGMEKTLQGFGIRSLEEIENLTDERKFQLNLQLESAFGMELGEIQRVVESFKESGKGLSDQLETLNKKRQQNLTLEEKAVLMEQERSLKTSAALSIVTGLNEATKGAKNMDEALMKFGRRRGEFEEDLKALGGDFTSLAGGAKFALTDAIKNVNEGLQKAGEKPITIDTTEIEKALKDPEALRMVTERIEGANKKLQQAQKAATDPATKTANTLEKYNDYFRNNYVAPLFNQMTLLIGAAGAITIALGLLGAKFALWGLTQTVALNNGFGSLATVFGRGAAGAAGAAASGAAGAAASGAAGAAASGGAAAASGAAGAAQSKAFALSWGQMAGHLKTLGIGLVGTVAGIAMLGLAIVAIGAVAAATKKALSVDPLQLAIDVSKVFFAAAIIGGEMALAFFALQAADRASGGFAKIFNPAVAQQLALAAAGIIVMTIAMMALARAILYIGDLMSYGIDADEAIHIAYTVSSILWGANAIMIAVAAGTAIMLGVGAMLFALSAGGIAGWALALAGIGALVLVGLAMVGIVAGMKKFFEKLAAADDGGFAQQAEKAINFLNAMNSVLLRLAPLFLIVIGMGIAAAAAMGLWPLTAPSIMLIGLLASLGVGLLFVPIVQGLMSIAEGIIEAASAVPSYDQKMLDETVKKMTSLMDAVNSVLWKLAPLFLTILGIGALIAAAMVFGGPAFGIAFLALAAAFAAALPHIVKGLVEIGKAIIETASSELANYNIDRSLGDSFYEKLNSMSYVILKLGTGYALVSGACILTATIFTYSSAILAATAISMLAVIVASAALISAMLLLDKAFWGYDLKQFADLAIKIMLFSVAIMMLSTALKLLSAYGAVSVLSFAGLLVYAGFLAASVEPIAKILKSFYDIGLMIYQTSVLLPLKKVIKGMKEITSFTVNLSSFISSINQMKMKTKLNSFMKNLLSKKSISEQLKEHLKEINEIINATMTAGLDRGKLEATNNIFRVLAEFAKNFGSTMKDMSKAFEVLDPKTWYGGNKQIFDAKAMNDNLTSVFSFMNDVIKKTVEQSANYSASDTAVAVAYMQTTASTMTAFAEAMTAVGSSLEKLFELQGGSWYNIFGTNKLAQFSTIVEEGGKQTTEFNKTINQIFTGITNLITDLQVHMNKVPDDMNEVVSKMQSLVPIINSFSEIVTVFGKALQEMFYDAYPVFGTDGPGKFLADNKETIKTGIQSIFEVLTEVLTTINEKIDTSSGPTAVASLQNMNNIFAGLNPALVTMAANLQEFSRIFKEDMSFLTPSKSVITGKEYWTEYNKVFDSMTTGVKSLGELLHGFANALAEGIGTLPVASLQKSSSNLIVVSDVLYYTANGLHNLNVIKKLMEKDLKFLTTGDTAAIDTIAQGCGTFLKSITNLANQITAGTSNLDVGSLNGVNERIGAISAFMEPLATTMESFAKNMTPLTKGTWLGMGSSIAEQIKESASGIHDSLNAVIGLASTIINAVKTMPDAKGFDEAAVKMSAMGKVVENLAPIMENLSSSLSTLTAKEGMGTSLQEYVQKLLTNFKSQEPIKNVFLVIRDVIVKPLLDLQVDPQDVQEAAQIMTSMAQILEALAKSLEVINISLAKVAKLGKPNDTQIDFAISMLQSHGNKIHWLLWALGTFVRPLLAVGEPQDVTDAAAILTGLGQIIEVLAGKGTSPGIITNINTSIAKLVKVTNKKGVASNEISKAAWNLYDFAVGFQYLLPSLAYLVNATNYAMSSPEDVTAAAEVLKGAGVILDVLPGILKNVNEKLPGMIQSVNDLQRFNFPALAGNVGISGALGVIGAFVDDIISADLQSLTSNITEATNDLSQLDTALIGLVNVMESVGGSMSRLGQISGKGISVNTSAAISAATSNITPGGSVATQVAMQSASANTGADFAGLEEGNTQTNSLLGSMIDVLQTIAGGVTSAGGGTPTGVAVETAKNWASFMLPSSSSTAGPNYGSSK